MMRHVVVRDYDIETIMIVLSDIADVFGGKIRAYDADMGADLMYAIDLCRRILHDSNIRRVDKIDTNMSV